jgi:CheY-like chemotaxis protein
MATSNPKTILIVDDDRPAREMARVILQTEGYLVHTAGDAPEALGIAGRFACRLNLLINDMIMTEIDGHELILAIRQMCPFVGTMMISGAFPQDDARARLASDEVRRLSHGLHPSVIEDFGLSTALEEFCEEFGNAYGISLSFDRLEADAGLRADGASCLYRIAQECLRNVAKHAGATGVRLSITNDGANVRLAVKANTTDPAPRSLRFLGVI